MLWVKGSLWVTQFGPDKIVQADADLNLFHDFDIPLNTAHGLGWDGEHIWCMFANDYRAPKFEIRTGRVLEAVQLDRSDPDPAQHDLVGRRAVLLRRRHRPGPQGQLEQTCRVDLPYSLADSWASPG